MFAAKILTFLASVGITLNSASVHAAEYGSNITHECMQTSEEFGQAEKDGVQIKVVSNMDNIVDIGDKSLFMRTASILVCSDNDYIHGVAVALDHDKEKDPAHNQFLDNFYSEDAGTPDYDKTFYEDLIGADEGECEVVDVPEGERIEAVMIYYSDGAIRNLQFKLSDGTYQLVGTNYDNSGRVKQEIVNFSHGEEILGIYGKTDNRDPESDDTERSPDHFVTMGFIVNQCDNMQMSQFSSQISKSSEQTQSSDLTVASLIAAVSILGLVLFIMMSYQCLKNRGKMLKKCANQDEDLSAFDSSKKAFKKPKHIVPQMSISNISMMNPVPAAGDDSV